MKFNSNRLDHDLEIQQKVCFYKFWNEHGSSIREIFNRFSNEEFKTVKKLFRISINIGFLNGIRFTNETYSFVLDK